jgi:hypothetical protein
MNITKEDPRFWDVRTVGRRIRRGLLNRKDYDKYLKSLPDIADKAQPIDLAASDEAEVAEEAAEGDGV